MKKTFFSCLMVALTLSFLLNAHAAGKATVEVLYMDHGPLMETVNQLKKLFSGYGESLSVSWYEFESKEGEEFMAKKGIRQHVPLVIWIEGKPKWTVGAKEVTFAGFPTGSGPPFFQGKWTMEDLRASLDQATSKK
jgi:hypothetical protein